jgi:hypothetical protein
VARELKARKHAFVEHAALAALHERENTKALQVRAAGTACVSWNVVLPTTHCLREFLSELELNGFLILIS